MIARTHVSTGLILLSILLAGTAGCVSPATQPPVTSTVAPGWERFVNQEECSYVIDHPSNMDVASEGAHSWLLSPTAAEPSGPVPNFVYLSVIPADVQPSGDEIIYNYDPVETQTLLSLQVGESKSLRDDPNLADWFRYNLLPKGLSYLLLWTEPCGRYRPGKVSGSCRVVSRL